MRRHRQAVPLAVAITTLLLLTPALASAQAPDKGQALINGTQVQIDYPSQFEQATVRVTKAGQAGVWTQTFPAGSSINGDLALLTGGPLADGFYRYEIEVTWPGSAQPRFASGVFKVVGGQIQAEDPGKTKSNAISGPTPQADLTVTGNLRVTGGGCFGCTAGTTVLFGKIVAVDIYNNNASAVQSITRYIVDGGGSWLVGNAGGDFIIDSTNGFFGMKGDTGHVGINTSSPAGELHVTRSGANSDLFVERTGANPSIALLSAPPDSVAFGTLSDDPFLIATNNIARIIIGAGGGVNVNGDFGVSGVKNFVEDHPTDPTKSIYYAAMEGPEAGTYVRGSANLVKGVAIIELPEHFGLVTEDEGITVQLTPRGEWLQAFVVEVSPRKLVLRERQGRSGRIDYRVEGVRKGYTDYQVIRPRPGDGK